jgi:hypothetical protein
MRRALLLLSIGLILLASPASGASFTERIDAIPDIGQTDPKCHFPSGGVHYCGPCAISNSLVWLGEHGYERLLPKAGDRICTQVELVNTLASRKYMDTTLEGGTSPAGVLTGIAKYLGNSGYEYRRLLYQGWRKVPAKFDTGVCSPRIEWIKSGLSGESAVWLNIGWYRYSPARKEYTRVGGHWVTLVGYGVDEAGKDDPDVIIIHDPGFVDGNGFFNDYVRVESIEGGTLVGGSGARCSASGS